MYQFKSTNRLLAFFIITIFIIALPLGADAKGIFTLKPKFTASWETDDNLYKAETVKREIYTYLIQPGFELGYETGKSILNFDYTLNSYYFRDQSIVPTGSPPADSENYTGHTAVLDLKIQPTRRFQIGLENVYYKTRDPASSDEFNNSITRDEYYINRLTPEVYYRFGAKFSAGLRYRYTKTDYLVVNREDSIENRPIFDLVYNLNSTTSVDLEYQYWKRDYDIGTSDYSSNQAKFIFRKQYKFFELEAGAGYQSRNFDDATLADIDIFTYRLGIIGQNPPDAEGMPRSHIAFIAESNLNDSGPGDAYFKATRFTLKMGHIFFDKFPAELSGRFQNSDYQRETGLTPTGTTAVRNDDLYAIEGSLSYLFNEWLSFKLSAGHENRDSNIAGRNYDNNYFMFQLIFSYSFGKR